MPRPHDRAATVVALVNAGVVYLLPVAGAGIIGAINPGYSTGSTTVTARGPDYVQHQVEGWVSYALAVAPFAMAAAWRTFVHATRWLEGRGSGWLLGVLEGGLCGFVAAVLILLPSISMKPLQAPPYVLVYGGLALVLGLLVAAILSSTALVTLHLLTRRQPHPPASDMTPGSG